MNIGELVISKEEDIQVLITDDSMFERKKLADMVKDEDFSVIEAANGKEAVELYQEERPELVLLDIIMDEMNGIEALKQILEMDPNAKIVIVSGIGHNETVKEAIEIGASRYIIKPIERDKVIPTVYQVLNNANNGSR